MERNRKAGQNGKGSGSRVTDRKAFAKGWAMAFGKKKKRTK